ncbi:metallophosphoesterase [Candidatus Bathyarchaeota archaeon]|nr:metallophosphoesterase [Candidatus Bathyarchaeota archaeon]
MNPVIPYPALLLKGADRSLIISDLHIGWEASLAEQGLHIPSQAPKYAERLRLIIKETDSARLIILGDVKHEVARVGLREWGDVPSFFQELLEFVEEIYVIPGNHDGNLEALIPERVKMFPVHGLTIDHKVGLIHGHAWPRPEILGCDTIILGHLHPMIRLLDAAGFSTTHQVWLRASSDGEVLARKLLSHLGRKLEGDAGDAMKRYFNVTLSNPHCIFIPSFNSLLSGQVLNRFEGGARLGKAYTGPLLRSNGIQLMDAEAYLLDGVYLGRLSDISMTGKFT